MLNKLVLSVLLLASPLTFAASWNKLYTQTLPSTVTVYTQDADGKPMTQGSGVVVLDGKVATTCHVVKNAAYIIVADNLRISAATVWGGMPEEDICLLEPTLVKFPAVKIGDSKKVEIGDEVFTIS